MNTKILYACLLKAYMQNVTGNSSVYVSGSLVVIIEVCRYMTSYSNTQTYTQRHMNINILKITGWIRQPNLLKIRRTVIESLRILCVSEYYIHMYVWMYVNAYKSL